MQKDRIDAFKNTDPREALLKHAQAAIDDPKYVTTAYAQNQPQVVAGTHLAATVDGSDDEEEQREGEGVQPVDSAGSSYQQQKNHPGRPSVRRENPNAEKYREGR